MNRFFPQWFARFVSRWFSRPFRNSGAPAGAHPARGAMPRGAMPQGTITHAPMLDCESVMRQLWDYLDGELTAERMAAIRAHIEMCKRCYPQYEFERSFLDALAARRRRHSDPERLRTKLISALQERGFSEV